MLHIQWDASHQDYKIIAYIGLLLYIPNYRIVFCLPLDTATCVCVCSSLPFTTVWYFTKYAIHISIGSALMHRNILNLLT